MGPNSMDEAGFLDNATFHAGWKLACVIFWTIMGIGLVSLLLQSL